MGRSNSVLDNQTLNDTKFKLIAPKMYKVLIHNDDYTTMDFVVHILETVFSKSSLEASEIMLNVHHKGVGECGVYSFEFAETKISSVHFIAKQYEFPLRCSMEDV